LEIRQFGYAGLWWWTSKPWTIQGSGVAGLGFIPWPTSQGINFGESGTMDEFGGNGRKLI
jgi:hypothetical protein